MRVLLFIVSLPHWSTSLGFKAALLHEYPACRLNTQGSGLCHTITLFLVEHCSFSLWKIVANKHHWCYSAMTPVNGCDEAYHPITKPIPFVPALIGWERWIRWVGMHMYEHKTCTISFTHENMFHIFNNLY